MRGSEIVYKIYVGKLKEKTSLGRGRSVWKDSGEMYTAEITCNAVEWIHEVPYRRKFIREERM